MAYSTPSTPLTVVQKRELREKIQASHPGALVVVEYAQGLLAVRKPTLDEVIQLEDAVGRLNDLSQPEDPFAGLDLVKSLIVHPAADEAEALLDDFAGSFDQVVALARVATFGEGGRPPLLRDAELTEEELYVGPPNEDGQRARRHGGRIFAVEHLARPPKDAPAGTKPSLVARYLMRRLGGAEHRAAMREINNFGFMTSGGRRSPTMAMLAKIARAHVVQPIVAGCSAPDFEQHPYLLQLLGEAVIDSSRLKVGGDEGKSRPV